MPQYRSTTWDEVEQMLPVSVRLTVGPDNIQATVTEIVRERVTLAVNANAALVLFVQKADVSSLAIAEPSIIEQAQALPPLTWFTVGGEDRRNLPRLRLTGNKYLLYTSSGKWIIKEVSEIRTVSPSDRVIIIETPTEV